jgi:hypothetical protein
MMGAKTTGITAVKEKSEKRLRNIMTITPLRWGDPAPYGFLIFVS